MSAEIEGFAMRVFGLAGMRVVYEAPDVVRVEGGRQALRGLSGRYAFSPEAARHYGAQLLSPGSVALDRLLDWAKRQGQVAVASLRTGENPRRLDLNSWTPGSAASAARQLRETTHELAAAFHFRLTTHGEGDEQELLTVVVSLRDHAVHRRLAPVFTQVLARSETPLVVSEPAVQEARGAALREVGRQKRQDLQQWASRVAERRAREVERIDTYLGAVEQEVEREKAEARSALAAQEHDLQGKISRARLARTEARYRDALAAVREREKAIDEERKGGLADLQRQRAEARAHIEQRSRPKATVALVALTVVQVPVLAYDVTLRGRGTERRLVVRVTQPAGDILGAPCEACEGEREASWLDIRGHLVCIECAKRCCVCQEAACPTCQQDLMTRCFICKDSACSSCSRVCGSCHRAVCAHHSIQCGSCREPLCTGCARACPRCQLATCPTCLATCTDCGRVGCRSHAVVCSVCKESFCNEHAIDCPACGNLVCGRHARYCAECGMQYCRACAPLSSDCVTCRDLRSPVPPEIKAWIGPIGGGTLEWGRNQKYVIVRRSTTFASRTCVYSLGGNLLRETSGSGWKAFRRTTLGL